jgi:hypothetical protein
VCEIALLGDANWLPDQSAKVLFQHQLDFNYLDMAHLGNEASTSKKGIHIGKMHYKAVVFDGLSNLPDNAIGPLQKLSENGRLIIYNISNLNVRPVILIYHFQIRNFHQNMLAFCSLT